jgi:hypothetical protein
MRFQYNQPCQCGGSIAFTTTGDNRFPPALCESCGRSGNLIDPLSPSVTADRLIYRSKAELEAGDYSVAILLAAIAVETFLTQIFLKLKGMEHYASGFAWPDEAQEALWEEEYPRSGGFPGPANFISNRLVGKSFDQFTHNNPTAQSIFAALPNPNSLPLSTLCQTELFRKRNRIAHWGYVNSTKGEAERCFAIALAVVGILKEMDRIRYS